MNVEELVEDATKNATQNANIARIKDFISILRDSGFNDEEIYQKIMKKMGKEILSDQLHELIKETM